MENLKEENVYNNELCAINMMHKKYENQTSQISISEFLNFLKTAYQVQDSIEGILMQDGMVEAVNWLKVKEAELNKKCKNISAQTSESAILKKSADEKKDQPKRKNSIQNLNQDSDVLKKKLSEVLSEGLLDSVLPYLTQNPSGSIRRSYSCASIKNNEKPNPKIQNLNSTNEKLIRRSSESLTKTGLILTDSEVEIHVCDEVKSMKKTFICNQKLLVEKMGYFAEVTLGQKLEDMDISVHCDIGIFEWLMQWVKKESVLEADWPQLDAQCVVPILVSAAFLQMEPLLQDCLLYCHQHMNEILRSSANLSCLNDTVLTRLAAMYTNSEIESIKDRKDKIQSKLFAKLIQSLAEPDPESVRGHWCSLARIFRCERCYQLINPNVASKIPCTPSCMRLEPDGSIISLHIRDSSWDINAYILELKQTLKTWRKVYWKLWGDCHFLFCSVCKRYFQVNQIGWCRYHPDTPQFFTLDAQRAPLPIGRFPCCGDRAYRFQLLENNTGCQFKQHIVNLEDVRHSAIFTMLENYRHILEEEPPQLLFPERLTRLVARDSISSSEKFVCKELFWWDGFEIIPTRPKLGLLSCFASRVSDEVDSIISDESTTEEFTEEETISSVSMGSEECSDESNPPPKKTVTRKPRKQSEGRLWQYNLSARSNQDIQRAYEEGLLKEVAILLDRNITNGSVTRNTRTTGKNLTPLGGLWVRLECEWKDTLNQKELQAKMKNVISNKFYKPRPKF